LIVTSETDPTKKADKPPEGSSTWRLILDVARDEVCERGIDGFSIRNIARLAGIDPRLVRHYFGSKERLLRAAVQVEGEPRQAAQQLLGGSPRTIGRRTANLLLDHWDDPRTAMPYRARLAASLTNDDIAGLMRDEFISVFFEALAEEYSPDAPKLRAVLAATEVIGIAICRYLVEEPTITECDRAELARVLGRAIQHHLTAELSPALRRRAARAGSR